MPYFVRAPAVIPVTVNGSVKCHLSGPSVCVEHPATSARFKIATKASQDRFSKGVYFIVGLTLHRIEAESVFATVHEVVAAHPSKSHCLHNQRPSAAQSTAPSLLV